MLPLKRLNGKTSAELWTGKKPNIEVLRVYRSKAYAHVNEQFRFEPKSKQMILVGYESKRKAYRLWLPGSNLVEVSRDVIIVELTPKHQVIRVPMDVNESDNFELDFPKMEMKQQTVDSNSGVDQSHRSNKVKLK